jgi:nicotinate-nucleotide--dimethylbenzimidazole phosphoribosyltransferase
MRIDDDNTHSYAPVLRRIIILVAVITAVPVMLWTITAFMRTYVAQPVIPSARPLAAVATTIAPGSTAADAATANPPAPAAQDANSSPPAPAIIEARATAADARNSDMDTRGDRMRDSAAAAPKAVTLATADTTLPATPMAAPPPAGDEPMVQAPPAAAAAPDVAPNSAPAIAAPPALPAAAADALPPSEPLTSPVPLPPRRPSVFAMAETGIPLPRARPAAAPEATPATSDTPPSGYEAGMMHY